MEAKYITVLCTVPSQESARQIAHTLINEKLAACCNIVPGLTSVYFWKGEVCEDAELLLIIKTTAAAFESLRERIRAIHPYEVPEIIALPIIKGHQDYLNWVEENVGKQEQ
ncbi:MAG: divalent-cation tolerance protein CutA [Calditrichaeota bacterium]|nr:divalent-cation tolerance protein CutA [Calditrichota bacterium]